MDFNAFIEDMRIAATNLEKGHNRKYLSSLYCSKTCKAIDKTSTLCSDYENVISGLCLITAHLLEQLGVLEQVPGIQDVASRLFRECSKAVLNIQWQNLEEDSSLRQNFLISLNTLNERLIQRNFLRFALLDSLTENPWTDPTLAKIMGGEAEDEEEKEEVRTYIENEDPVILQLRVDMMLKENCEEYAMNLCNSCLTHPDLRSDLKLRKIQLTLLHKLGHTDRLQEECQKLSTRDAILIIRQLQTKVNREICTVLAQTFMVQNWIRPSDQEANKELLRLWIKQQVQVDKEQDRFKESAWDIAKLSQSTEQVIFFIDILREQCGGAYLQLYLDMCIFAINVDKGQMETNLRQDNTESAIARKSDMAAICSKLACLIHHNSDKVARMCVLTAFALTPSEESYESINKFFSSTNDCCGTCVKDSNVEPGVVNPATLYEVERLLNMLRPEYLTWDTTLTNVQSLCKRYLQERLSSSKNIFSTLSTSSTQVEGPGKKKTDSANTKTHNLYTALSPHELSSTQVLLSKLRLQQVQHLTANHPQRKVIVSSPPQPTSTAVIPNHRGWPNILQTGGPRRPNPASVVGEQSRVNIVNMNVNKQSDSSSSRPPHPNLGKLKQDQQIQLLSPSQLANHGPGRQSLQLSSSNSQRPQRPPQQHLPHHQQLQQKLQQQLQQKQQQQLQQKQQQQQLQQKQLQLQQQKQLQQQQQTVHQLQVNQLKSPRFSSNSSAAVAAPHHHKNNENPQVVGGRQPTPNARFIPKPSSSKPQTVYPNKFLQSNSKMSTQQSISSQCLPTVSTLLNTGQNTGHLPPSSKSSLSLLASSKSSSYRKEFTPQHVIQMKNINIDAIERQQFDSSWQNKPQNNAQRGQNQQPATSRSLPSQQRQHVLSKQMSGAIITVNRPQQGHTIPPNFPKSTIQSSHRQNVINSLPPKPVHKMPQQPQQLQLLLQQGKQDSGQFGPRFHSQPSRQQNQYVQSPVVKNQPFDSGMISSTASMSTAASQDAMATLATCIDSTGSQNQTAPSSEELSGSIMGIDDTIISELLQDSGIFSNTFPDIEVEDINKVKPDGAMGGTIQFKGGLPFPPRNSTMRSQIPSTVPASLGNVGQNNVTSLNSKRYSASNSNNFSPFYDSKQINFSRDSIINNTISNPSSKSSHIDSNTLNQRQFPIDIKPNVSLNIDSGVRESKYIDSGVRESKYIDSGVRESKYIDSGVREPKYSSQQSTVEQLREKLRREQIEGEVTMDASNNASYRCIICSLAFAELEELREHVRNVCKPGLQSSSVYNNRIEQDRAKSAKAGLETTTVFQCLRCFELCISDTGIKQHRLTCKRVPTVPPDIKHATLTKNKTSPSSAGSSRSSTPKALIVKKEVKDNCSSNKAQPDMPLTSFSSYPSVNAKALLETLSSSAIQSQPIPKSTTITTTLSTAISTPVSVEPCKTENSQDSSSNSNTLPATTSTAGKEDVKPIEEQVEDPVPKAENQNPKPLPSPDYSEISGSGGSKFYRCKVCSQTLCSLESLYSHWKECFAKNTSRAAASSAITGATTTTTSSTTASKSPGKPAHKLFLFEEDLEPGEIRPLFGRTLENVVSVISSVARGFAGNTEDFDSDAEASDHEVLLAIVDPCRLSRKPGRPSSARASSTNQMLLNKTAPGVKNFVCNTVTNVTASHNPNKMFGTSHGKCQFKEVKANKKTVSTFSDFNSEVRNIQKGSENKDSSSSSVEESNSLSGFEDDDQDEKSDPLREALPKLRDRNTLKPIHSFINESFASQYSKGRPKKEFVSKTKTVPRKIITSSTFDEALVDEDNVCRVCKKPFPNERILLQHYASKHLMPYTVKTLSDCSCYFCHLCQKTFTTFRLYMLHVPNHRKTILEKIKHSSPSRGNASPWSMRLASSRGFVSRQLKPKIGKQLSPKMASALKSKRKAAKSVRQRLRKLWSKNVPKSVGKSPQKASAVTRRTRSTSGTEGFSSRNHLTRRCQSFTYSSSPSDEDSNSHFTVSDENSMTSASLDSESLPPTPPQTRRRKRSGMGVDVADDWKQRTLNIHSSESKDRSLLPVVSVQRMSDEEIERYLQRSDKRNRFEEGASDSSVSTRKSSSRLAPSFQASFESFLNWSHKKVSPQKTPVDVDENSVSSDQTSLADTEASTVSYATDTSNGTVAPGDRGTNEILTSIAKKRCSVNLGEKLDISSIQVLSDYTSDSSEPGGDTPSLPENTSDVSQSGLQSSLVNCAVRLERSEFVEKCVLSSDELANSSDDMMTPKLDISEGFEEAQQNECPNSLMGDVRPVSLVKVVSRDGTLDLEPIAILSTENISVTPEDEKSEDSHSQLVDVKEEGGGISVHMTKLNTTDTDLEPGEDESGCTKTEQSDTGNDGENEPRDPPPADPILLNEDEVVESSASLSVSASITITPETESNLNQSPPSHSVSDDSNTLPTAALLSGVSSTVPTTLDSHSFIIDTNDDKEPLDDQTVGKETLSIVASSHVEFASKNEPVKEEDGEETAACGSADSVKEEEMKPPKPMEELQPMFSPCSGQEDNGSLDTTVFLKEGILFSSESDCDEPPERSVDIFLETHLNETAVESKGNRTESVETAVESKGNRTESVETAVESEGNRTESVGTAVESEGNQIESVETAVESEGNLMESVETAVESEGNQIESVETAVESEGNQMESVETAVESEGNQIESVETAVESEGNQMESVETAVESEGNLIESVETAVESEGNQVKSAETAVESEGNRIESVKTLEHDEIQSANPVADSLNLLDSDKAEEEEHDLSSCVDQDAATCLPNLPASSLEAPSAVSSEEGYDAVTTLVQGERNVKAESQWETNSLLQNTEMSNVEAVHTQLDTNQQSIARKEISRNISVSGESIDSESLDEERPEEKLEHSEAVAQPCTQGPSNTHSQVSMKADEQSLVNLSEMSADSLIVAISNGILLNTEASNEEAVDTQISDDFAFDKEESELQASNNVVSDEKCTTSFLENTHDESPIVAFCGKVSEEEIKADVSSEIQGIVNNSTDDEASPKDNDPALELSRSQGKEPDRDDQRNVSGDEVATVHSTEAETSEIEMPRGSPSCVEEGNPLDVQTPLLSEFNQIEDITNINHKDEEETSRTKEEMTHKVLSLIKHRTNSGQENVYASCMNEVNDSPVGVDTVKTQPGSLEMCEQLIKEVEPIKEVDLIPMASILPGDAVVSKFEESDGNKDHNVCLSASSIPAQQNFRNEIGDKNNAFGDKGELPTLEVKSSVNESENDDSVVVEDVKNYEESENVLTVTAESLLNIPDTESKSACPVQVDESEVVTNQLAPQSPDGHEDDYVASGTHIPNVAPANGVQMAAFQRLDEPGTDLLSIHTASEDSGEQKEVGIEEMSPLDRSFHNETEEEDFGVDEGDSKIENLNEHVDTVHEMSIKTSDDECGHINTLEVSQITPEFSTSPPPVDTVVMPEVYTQRGSLDSNDSTEQEDKLVPHSGDVNFLESPPDNKLLTSSGFVDECPADEELGVDKSLCCGNGDCLTDAGSLLAGVEPESSPIQVVEEKEAEKTVEDGKSRSDEVPLSMELDSRHPAPVSQPSGEQVEKVASHSSCNDVSKNVSLSDSEGLPTDSVLGDNPEVCDQGKDVKGCVEAPNESSATHCKPSSSTLLHRELDPAPNQTEMSDSCVNEVRQDDVDQTVPVELDSSMSDHSEDSHNKGDLEDQVEAGERKESSNDHHNKNEMKGEAGETEESSNDHLQIQEELENEVEVGERKESINIHHENMGEVEESKESGNDHHHEGELDDKVVDEEREESSTDHHHSREELDDKAEVKDMKESSNNDHQKKGELENEVVVEGREESSTDHHQNKGELENKGDIGECKESGTDHHHSKQSTSHDIDDEDLSDYDLVIEEDTSYNKNVFNQALLPQASIEKPKMVALPDRSVKSDHTSMGSDANNDSSLNTKDHRLEVSDGLKSIKDVYAPHRFNWDDIEEEAAVKEKRKPVAVKARLLERKQNAFKVVKSESEPFMWDLEDSPGKQLERGWLESKTIIESPSICKSLSFDKLEQNTPNNSSVNILTNEKRSKSKRGRKPKKNPSLDATLEGKSLPKKKRRSVSTEKKSNVGIKQGTSIDSPSSPAVKTPKVSRRRTGYKQQRQQQRQRSSESPLVHVEPTEQNQLLSSTITNTTSNGVAVNDDISFNAVDDDISFNIKSYSPVPLATPTKPKAKLGRPRKRNPTEPLAKKKRKLDKAVPPKSPESKDTVGEKRVKGYQKVVSDDYVSLPNNHQEVENSSSEPKRIKLAASPPEPADRLSPKLKKAGLIRVAAKGPSKPNPSSTDNIFTRSSEAALKAFNKKSLRNREVEPADKLAVSGNAKSPQQRRSQDNLKQTKPSPSPLSLASAGRPAANDQVNHNHQPSRKVSKQGSNKDQQEGTAAVVKRRNPSLTRKNCKLYGPAPKKNAGKHSATSTTTIFRVEPIPKENPPKTVASSISKSPGRTLHTALPTGMVSVGSKKKQAKAKAKWKIDKEMKPTKVKSKQMRSPISFRKT